MAKQPRRLGRGIASLLAEADAPHPALREQTGAAAITRELPLQTIAPNPNQPRSGFDAEQLKELAESIRTAGVIQPVIVRPKGAGYELAAGERRVRAARIVGLATIPAVVREVTDEQMAEIALIENIQREDLNPMDRAAAYKAHCDQFDLTVEALAGRLGEDRSTVANYIRLLDLPDSVQQLVRAGSVWMGHARSLLGLPDHAAMEQLAQETIANGFSVRHLEGLVRSYKPDGAEPKPDVPPKPAAKRPLIQELEERFSERLQTKVTIHEGRKKHTGRIVIAYYSLDDFDRIAERLGINLDEV